MRSCRSFDSIRSALFHHMTPLPHPAQGSVKKADMFEGNVLVKKYRGGRQEDYLKKVSHYFGIYQSLFIYLFYLRFLCRTFETLFLIM